MEYMIVSNDYLQTAFFVGTAEECIRVLQVTKSRFYSAVCRNLPIHRAFRIERMSDNGEGTQKVHNAKTRKPTPQYQIPCRTFC